MRAWVLSWLLVSPVAFATEPNPHIDAVGFADDVASALIAREQRRIDDATFIAMANEPHTVILDARSSDAFDRLHVDGAINLPFTDFTAERLAQAIPSKSTRVLIYCNNNFLGSPGAFPTKAPAASLNLSTFVALQSYGYRHVYELATLRDIAESSLPLVGSDQRRPQ
jgi:hypothetical protein